MMVASTAAILFSSCMDSFLDTTSPSKSSSENVFETTAMADAVLMGIYSGLTDSYVYGQKLSVNWQGVTDVEVGSNCFNTKNYRETNGDAGGMSYYDDPYNSTTKWSKLFENAERACAAVDGIRESSLMNTSDRSTMLGYLGEALVLKAMNYFELVRYWGDIPYKDHGANSDLSNVYIGKVDKDTIYNHLIADLKEAVDYLPWMGTNSYNAERITKGFALGMLARVALFAGGWSIRDGNTFPDLDVEHNPNIEEMGGYFVGRPKNYKEYYQIAVDACAQLLSDPENPHQLDPDFEDIWAKVNHLELNPYNENLFEVAFGEGQSGDIGALIGYEVGKGVFNASRGLGGAGYASTTLYFFYSYDQDDKRRDITCTFPKYEMKDGKAKETIGFNPFGIACGKWNWKWMTDEYINVRFPVSTSRVSTGINWILMRYSDIYLMFAEAMNELYGSSTVNEQCGLTAEQALETVRERAFGAGSSKIKDYDHSSKEGFFEAITNERAWEFACESLRKQDLVRWGLSVEKIEKMKETLCMMYDYQFPLQIFDKTYNEADMPRRVYYKYQSDNPDYIDRSSMNLYKDEGVVDANTAKGEYSVNWVPMLITLDGDGNPNETINKSYVETMCKILVIGTGLNASYDYSDLYGELRWGNEVQTEMTKYPLGNGVCNYRHLFAIYYEDVFESQGMISNSYGFSN